MGQRSIEVDAYLEVLPAARREALTALRDLIHEVEPRAHETMGYRMPTFELEGRTFLSMASQKHYLAIYAGIPVLDRFREAFSHLSLGKSCLRFRYLEDLDLDTLRELVSVAAGAEGFC